MDNIDELIALIPEDKAEEVKEFVTKQVESEKEIGISKYNKKDQEALKLKSHLKELGYDKEKFESFEAFKNSISKTKETADNSALTLSQLNEKLENLNEKYTAEVSRREAKETELTNEKIRRELTKNIGDKLYGSDALIENIMLKKSLSIVDDKIVDREGNSFEDFTKSILEKNKDNIKPTQKHGFDNKVKQTKVDQVEDSIVEKAKKRMKAFQK